MKRSLLAAILCSCFVAANECKAQEQVDVVFVVDASSSMLTTVGTVIPTLSEYVQRLDADPIDAQYAIVLIGGTLQMGTPTVLPTDDAGLTPPELMQDLMPTRL